MTYRLLFSPKSSLSSTKFNHDKSDDYGVLIKYQYNNVDGANGDHRTRIDFTSPRVKKVLEHYFSMPIPPEHADPRNCPHYDSISCPKIASLLKRGAPYPIDMYMHMDALLKPLACPTLYAPRDKELYSDYPTFATRLRELEFYLNNQKPRNLRQAWQDRRDTVGYFTFWSVIFVGVATIVLALISIAISTAQTVATFQALNVSPSNQ
ncbi:hypothetical protein BDW02DRAFT_567712 [Decorospora gaudefroyi]|uniref:Uncharacterized protein n=1 Tax=Decorospora gaudefroyi TaxID=184978 RepID=A0A6A5KMT5_9PLEO|nr:hypothetical protein BDW02DRAFT_567712 [Decorospora gaudefroyi]